MERSSRYCLSLIICGILAIGCQKGDTTLYDKEISEEDKKLVYLQLEDGLSKYYQGSTKEQILLREMVELLPAEASAHRELGIPYLKRGIAEKYIKHYDKAMELSPEDWAGYSAYNKLYFYRDYKGALKDAELCDSFTEDFVDYPQSTSVDYMRGVCYYHIDDLGNKELAYRYLKKHLARERADVEDEYVLLRDYVHFAVAAIAVDKMDEAQEVLDIAMKHHPQNTEIFYYQALIQEKLGDRESAKQLLTKAMTAADNNYHITRPYVEEFFRVYKEDIADALRRLDSNTI